MDTGFEATQYGHPTATGNERSVLQKLAATIVEFDPRFEITPGTKPVAEREQIDPYEAVPRQAIAE